MGGGWGSYTILMVSAMVGEGDGFGPVLGRVGEVIPKW